MEQSSRVAWKNVLKDGTLLLNSTLPIMGGAAISTALRDMAIFFGDVPNSEFLTKLCLTITALAFVVFAPISGIIIDKTGKKPILITSLFLYIIAGTSGFYLRNIYAILVGRIVLGIAVAGIINSTLTLIADYYQGQKRNRMIGFQSAFGAFGGVIFVFVGGAMSEIGWNYPFLLYFLPVLFIPTTILSLPEPKREQPEIIEEKVEIATGNFDKTEERKTSAPIVVISYILIFITFLIFYIGPSQFSFYLPTIDPDISNTLVAIALAAVNLTAGLIALTYREIRKVLDYQLIFIIGYVFMGAGIIVFSIAKTYAIIIVAAVIAGLGWGVILPNTNLFLVNNTAEKIRGRIFSGFNSMIYLGQFLSPIIFKPIIEATCYSTSFLIGGITIVCLILIPIVFIITSFIKRRNESMAIQ